MRYEVFTLGKHYLQVHTTKGFTLFANAKLTPAGEVVSYTDTLVRRGGTWVIDCHKFLTVKYFPQNPIYCAVFGFDENDTEVKVTATDIDVSSVSGVNGQMVDIGNISLPAGESLPVSNIIPVSETSNIMTSPPPSANLVKSLNSPLILTFNSSARKTELRPRPATKEYSL